MFVLVFPIHANASLREDWTAVIRRSSNFTLVITTNTPHQSYCTHYNNSGAKLIVVLRKAQLVLHNECATGD
jgi:hypothetical protein